MVNHLNQIATFGLSPDLTIVLDVPVTTSLKRGKRQRKKKDRLEKERFEFHQRIREGFLKIARQNKRRIKVVDGTQDIGGTWRNVKKAVDSFLGASAK